MAKANGMHNWHLLSDILHSICKDSDHRRNSFFSRYINLQLPTGFFLNIVTDKPKYIIPDDSVSKTIKAKWLLELC